ncbi:hypothetical protein MEO40_12420 [Dolichospermum sp. ST_sed1]|nr:hypothetical protein [Dolichospermum sp. ST_sed1]
MKKKSKTLLTIFAILCNLTSANVFAADLNQVHQTFLNQQKQIEQLLRKLDGLSGNNATAGNAVSFHYCDNARYACSPSKCVSTCQAQGKRMATRDEVFTVALRGENSCRYVWMADGNKAHVVISGYPMYNYQGSGCVNTYSTPILASVSEHSWDSNQRFDCACAK